MTHEEAMAPPLVAYCEHKVVLSTAGSSRLPLLKTLRDCNASLSPKQAKEALEVLPLVVLTSSNTTELVYAHKALEEAGAVANIEPPLRDLGLMPVPPSAIQELRNMGLTVLEDVDSKYTRQLGRVEIAKWAGAPGNRLPGEAYEWPTDSGEILLIDTPVLRLFGEDYRWCVEDPYSGYLSKFRNDHATLGDAIADIHDYFFGDPARMLAVDEEEPKEPEVSWGEAMANDCVSEPCKRPGCGADRVHLSLFCPKHHVEMLFGSER